MDNNTIFTKTAKGLGETLGKTKNLSRDNRKILKEIDGKAALADVQDKLGMDPTKLQIALTKLLADDYIREFGSAAPMHAAVHALASMGDTEFGLTLPGRLENADSQLTIGDFFRAVEDQSAVAESLDFKSLLQDGKAGPQEHIDEVVQLQQARRAVEEEARRKFEGQAQRAAEARTRQQAEEQAHHAAEQAAREAAAQAGKLAAQQAQQQAAEQAKREAAARLEKEAQAARLKAEQEARQQAEQQARRAAELQARTEAEQRARQAAEQQARHVAEEKARRDAEAQAQAQARQAAEEAARRDAEARAKQDAEQQARQVVEEQARRDAAEAARRDAEAQATREAEQQQARRQAEQQQKNEAELQARLQAEQQAVRDAEQRAQAEAQEQARRQAEAQAKKEAEIQAQARARQEAEEQAQQAAIARAQAEAEQQAQEQARRLAEEQARKEAHEQARIKAHAAARRVAEELAQREAETRAKREAEEQARLAAEQAERQAAEASERAAAEEQARLEAQARARQAAEEQARQAAEEQARLVAEEQARQAAEEQARQLAQQRARQEAEEQARLQAEEKARQATEEKARRDAEAQARKDAKERAKKEAEDQARIKAEEKARQKAAEQARKDAEAQARKEAKERAKKEAEDQARIKAEEKAEEKARQAAEAQAMREAEQRARDEARAKAEAEARARANTPLETVPDLNTAEPVDITLGQDDVQPADLPAMLQANDIAGQAPAMRKPWLVAPTNIAKLVRLGMLGLMLVLVCIIALVHVIPFGGMLAQLETAASEQLQQPVSIKRVRLSLFPQPHWRLDDVAIGKEGQITAAQVDAHAGLASLFGDKLAFKAIVFHSPVITDQGMGWLLFGTGKATGIEAASISATNARLMSEHIRLPVFEAAAEMRDSGGWDLLVLRAIKENIRIELRPKGDAMQADLTAQAFVLPFGSSLKLDEFNLTGIVTRDQLTITTFNGVLYDGVISGTGLLKWGPGWSLTGELNAKHVDPVKFMPALLQSGRLEGNMKYAFQAADAGNLMATLRGKGSFTVANGVLLGADLANLVMGQDGSGKSSFNQITGDFATDGGKTQLTGMQLSAGLVSANGNAAVDAQNKLNGNFTVDLRTASRQARGNLALSGMLDAPKFGR